MLHMSTAGEYACANRQQQSFMDEQDVILESRDMTADCAAQPLRQFATDE